MLRPFITVVIRTQGKRISQLKEAVLSLAAQQHEDFNILIVGHDTESSNVQKISEFLSTLPFGFQQKLQFDLVQGGSRAMPLNYGLVNSTGQYITFLDDDDLVLPNWLSVFHDLSISGKGQVLRSRAVVQDFEVLDNEFSTSKAKSGFGIPYSADFSLLEHIIHNQSPFMTLAFPRTLHSFLGLEFNELLSSTEDWDFLLRSVSLVGLKNSKEVTAIYRKWENLETSADLHQLEWDSNAQIILGTLSKQPLMLPRGELLRIPGVLNKYAELIYRDRFEFDFGKRLDVEKSTWYMSDAKNRHEINLATGRLLTTYYSRSWRWTEPARRIVNLIRRRKSPSIFVVDFQNARMMNEFVDMIQGSVWWRLTKPLRRAM